MALEGIAEHRLGCDRLDARVESRELHLLERLFPMPWDQAPAHRDQLALAIRRADRINDVGRADVIARLNIGRSGREVVEPEKLLPGVVACKPTAHLKPAAISDRRPPARPGGCFPCSPSLIRGPPRASPYAA